MVMVCQEWIFLLSHALQHMFKRFFTLINIGENKMGCLDVGVFFSCSQHSGETHRGIKNGLDRHSWGSRELWEQCSGLLIVKDAKNCLALFWFGKAQYLYWLLSDLQLSACSPSPPVFLFNCFRVSNVSSPFYSDVLSWCIPCALKCQ